MQTPARVLEIAVAAPVDGTFDYLPPEGAGPLLAGQRLRVPFGRATRTGLLLGVRAESTVPPGRLKRALAVLDPEPLLPPDLVGLIRWASGYYQHPVGDVFATALPKALRQGGPLATGEPRWRLSADGAAIGTGTLRPGLRRRVMEAMADGRANGAGFGATELARLGKDWRRAVRELAARGWLDRIESPPDGRLHEQADDAPDESPTLNDAQQAAVNQVLSADGFRCFLLDGVTGSGKTEVYLRCIADVLARDRQCLLIVPEIGLTPQLLRRFRRRFRVPVAEYHSGLTDAERLRAWTEARRGLARIIVGTRSAIYLPLPQPGLLIVDEEHDASLKQQEGFRYSARDLAVWRARSLSVPLVLGSATPSMESADNARSGRYTRLVLPDRAGRAGAPDVRLIDLRRWQPTEGLSTPLKDAIGRHLEAGGQVLLYLNRRGYAPALLCTGCGWSAGCRRCDSRLVFHQREGRLRCHHCDSGEPAPAACPECGAPPVPVGQGTERLENALAAAFPGETVLRIDRDTTRRRGAIQRHLAEVRSGKARLLLGTQMLAKGHDFPEISLVGVVDADQGLFGTDFRSTERLAQAIVQVSGRAGRADRPGEVYIQTLFPDHPLLRILVTEGYGRFTDLALAERRQAGWPPYSYLALLRAEGNDRPAVFRFLDEAAAIGRQLLGTPGGTMPGDDRSEDPAALRLLGPAPAPMERRSGRFRGQLLLQAGTRRALHALLPGWRAALRTLPSGRRARWSLDVDPVELF